MRRILTTLVAVLGLAIMGSADGATVTTFSGEMGVDYPVGAASAIDLVEIDGTVTLTRDCDWRGLGDIFFKPGAKIDLNGHRLDLPAVAPARLQPVAYVESTGSQVINTGIVPGPTTSLDIDFTTCDGYFESTLFGTGNWNQHEYMLTLRNDGGRPMSFCWFGNYQFFTFYPNYHFRLVVDSANGALTLFDGDTAEQLTQLATTDFLCNCGRQLAIFGQNNTTKCGKFRIHAFKITQGGTLVRDFVPVRDPELGSCGLYDKVEGRYYPANGLLRGADVGGLGYPTDRTRTARIEISRGDLPPGYALAGYVESTGGQVIMTGVVPGTTTSLDIDFSTLEYVNEGSLFGTQYWNQRAYMFTLQGNQFRWFGNAEMFTFYPNKHLRMVFDCNDKKIYVYDGDTAESLNTVTVGDNSFTNTQNQELSLFGENNGAHAGKYRIRALKITQGGTLVRDYVAAVRLSDMKPGLYDQVGGAFHTADGLKWQPPEITDSTLAANDFRPSAWIQSTGAQVLNTGVAPGATTSLDIDFETFAWAAENSLFAAAGFNQHEFLLTPRSDFGSQQFCWFGNYKAFDYFPNRHLRMVVDPANGAIVQYDGETGEELTRLATTDFACNSGGTLTLFGLNNGTKAGKYRIYAMKVYQGGTLVRDFVPGYSAAQKRYGLYDRVNHQFHGADGLLSGPAVEYTPTAGTQGTLGIEVAENVTYMMAEVPLSGSLGIEKSGAGTLAVTRSNDYTGTTMVNAGTLAIGLDGATAPLGALGNQVVVGADGKLDFNANGAFHDYFFTFDFADRSVASGTRVVDWQSAPANLDTLHFQAVSSRPRVKYRVAVKDDGVYVYQLQVLIIVR